MKIVVCFLFLLCFSTKGYTQFTATAYQEGWDSIPPQAQKEGFHVQKCVLVNMDEDFALERVILFGRDLGHYPLFDLFKCYYAIVDNYTMEIQYTSEVFVTDVFDLTVEDRNGDGFYELYRKYFKDGKYTTDEKGYNLNVIRCCDRVEWKPGNKK